MEVPIHKLQFDFICSSKHIFAKQSRAYAINEGLVKFIFYFCSEAYTCDSVKK